MSGSGNEDIFVTKWQTSRLYLEDHGMHTRMENILMISLDKASNEGVKIIEALGELLIYLPLLHQLQHVLLELVSFLTKTF
jgi:hypothetical protein